MVIKVVSRRVIPDVMCYKEWRVYISLHSLGYYVYTHTVL